MSRYSKVNIFDFTDYRLFMKAFYQNRKERVGSFTYRRFSELALNASPNFVKLVIDGQRNLTIQNIYLFGMAMELLPREQEYFEAMVHFNQETHPECANLYRRRMLDLRSDTSYVLKNPTTFVSRLESYWEESAPWDLICYSSGKTLAELRALAEVRIPLNAEMIEKIIRDAIEEGILFESEEGTINLVAERLKLDQRWKSSATHKYVANQIADSLVASKRFYSKPFAKFSTIIFSVKDLKDLERKIDRLARTIHQEFLIDDKCEPKEEFSLARMTYQMFPVLLDEERGGRPS